MNITIIVENKEGEILAQRSSSSFESAGEDLGKLERYIEMKDNELKDKIKYGEVVEV